MTKQYPLTARQRQTLNIIKAFTSEHGIAPSQREIRDALSLKSLGHVSALLLALEERGYIDRLPGKGRAIRLLTSDNANHEHLKNIKDAVTGYIQALSVYRAEYDSDMTSSATKLAGTRVAAGLDRLKALVEVYDD
jgi:SOS-response transcriptional repressor LexA